MNYLKRSAMHSMWSSLVSVLNFVRKRVIISLSNTLEVSLVLYKDKLYSNSLSNYMNQTKLRRSNWSSNTLSWAQTLAHRFWKGSPALCSLYDWLVAWQWPCTPRRQSVEWSAWPPAKASSLRWLTAGSFRSAKTSKMLPQR